jgi:pimeloyl-ACP methyl ester carboxylesterase
MALYADDVAALAEELGPPVVLGGISMGAALALRLAALRPELVRAMVLIRPAWVDEVAPENMWPVAEVAGLLGRWTPPEARDLFLQGETAKRLAQDAPDNLSSLLGYFDSASPGRAGMLAAIASDGPGIAEEEIAAIDVPTLVCATDEDAVHPLAMAKRLAGLVPGARLVELPPKGRGRAPHFAALHAALADFLKELT